MNQLQVSETNMISIVSDHINKNQQTLFKLPGFQGFYQELNQIEGEIQNLQTFLSGDKTAATSKKNDAIEDAIVKASSISIKLTALAVTTGDKLFEKEVKTAEYLLQRMNGNELLGSLSHFIELAYRHKAELEIFGVTDAFMQEVNETRNRLNSFLVAPRASILEFKEKHARLDLTLNNAKETLYKMDALVNLMRYDNPREYEAWQSARKVITRSGSFALIGYAECSTTNVPLTGVQFVFTSLTGDTQPTALQAESIVKTTADKGSFYIRSLAAGRYTVDVSKTGYQKQTVEIEVDAYERYDLNVTLQQN